MQKYMIFDTETNGLFDFSKPADADGQPRLASLAMIILDGDLKVESAETYFVKPDGWKMTEGATAVNGLTDEYLEANGIPIEEVLLKYSEIVDAGIDLYAFNAQYDTKVMRSEFRKLGLDDRFEQTKNTCIMKALIDVCQIPRKSGKAFKYPKLVEACAHFGIDFPNQHTEMGDATVTMELLKKLIELDMLPEPEVHYAKKRPV